MPDHSSITRITTGVALGVTFSLVLGVMLSQSHGRDSELALRLQEQGAFGADDVVTKVASAATFLSESACHQAGENCDDGGGCCDANYNCIDDNGNEDFICRLAASSFSSSEAAYCCAFNIDDGTMGGCIATVPGGDDTCFGGGPVYDTPDCDVQCPAPSSSSSSSEQWCCVHALPAGPGNCSMI